MDITLSAEQEALFKIMEQSSQHLFITGRAGTGKSVLLRHFRENTKKRVVVTAPTGIAALNVRGQTIHSLFKLPPQLYRKGSLSPNTRLYSLLKRIDCLVIDEVSMVRADLLDAIDERLRKANQNDIAFGGVQVIMFGDVYQLPPIVEENLAPYFESVHGGHFFFNALAWREAEFKVYELTQVFRQKDPAFRDVLNAVRDGTIVDDQIEVLNARYGIPTPDEGTITLATTNALVTQINQRKLDQLPGKLYEYRAVITGEMKRSVFPTEENLQLKEGAQVVLLKNDKDARWVNGTVGKIEELSENEIKVRIGEIVYTLEKESWEEIVYEYDHDTQKVSSRVASSFTQFPIRLAWALTIHKSQGQTYESVALDLTTATFAAGQLYVALSRCTSLEGLYLKMPVRRSHIIVEPKVISFMSRCETIQVEVIEDIHHDKIIVEEIKIHHDEIDIPSINVQEEIHHDEIVGDTVVAQSQLDHDEKDEELTRTLAISKLSGHELFVALIAESNRREKKGRTKKERKSTQGRKPKSGVVREPMQLSLDARTIQVLNEMGVNKSQLYEELLQQHEPFFKMYTAVIGTAPMVRADKCSDAQARDADLAELRAKMDDQARTIEDQAREISRLAERLNVEKRYLQERGTRKYGFKAFLKKQPSTPFIEKFLADQFALPRDTRAHYEYRLPLLHCTEEERQEFTDLWKLMLLLQP